MATWLAVFEWEGTDFLEMEIEASCKRVANSIAEKMIENEKGYEYIGCEFVPTEDRPEEPDEPVEFYLRRIKAPALPGFEGLVYGEKG